MKTSKKQISLFTEDELTSLREDFRANPTALQENKKEQTMIAIYGPKCFEQFERLSRGSLWGKTFLALLLGMTDWYSKRCKLIWKMKGTKYSRLRFLLQASTHHISVTEYGLLPTPTASEGKRGSVRDLTVVDGIPMNIDSHGKRYGVGIRQLAEQGFLPSPLASDATTGAIIGKNDKFVITSTGMPRKINQNGTDGSVGLARLGKLGMLPTPRARAAGGNTSRDRGKGNLEDKIAQAMLPTPTANEGFKYTKKSNPKSQGGSSLTPLMNEMTGQSSQLKPQFVMEMMGFPPNWTLLPFLNGEELDFELYEYRILKLVKDQDLFYLFINNSVIGYFLRMGFFKYNQKQDGLLLTWLGEGRLQVLSRKKEEFGRDNFFITEDKVSFDISQN